MTCLGHEKVIGANSLALGDGCMRGRGEGRNGGVQSCGGEGGKEGQGRVQRLRLPLRKRRAAQPFLRGVEWNRVEWWQHDLCLADSEGGGSREEWWHADSSLNPPPLLLPQMGGLNGGGCKLCDLVRPKNMRKYAGCILTVMWPKKRDRIIQ